MDLLDSFLAEHARATWSWGVVDCSLALADWAIALGHPDPATAWRGTYSDEATWRDIVDQAGGLLPVVADVCDRAGFPALSAPERGAIGVIGRPRPDRQWGAIFDGNRWLIRAVDGFGPLIAPPLRMWSVRDAAVSDRRRDLACHLGST